VEPSIPFQLESQQLFEQLLEVLNFLQTEFLRVVTKRGLQREDLPTALTSLAVSTIDSLKAALLLCRYDDFQSAAAMLRRFEECFTLMLYFVLVDDGTVLTRWFAHPHLVLGEGKYKVRSHVAEKTKAYFSRNPEYDFKGNFDFFSRTSVHATWESSRMAVVNAFGRYGLLNPGSQFREEVGARLHQGRAVMFLGVMGPLASRFLEFLEKSVFPIPELANVSPGSERLKRLDEQILHWAIQVQPLVERMGEEATGPSV
jgi:hypothetical protein